MGRLEGKVAIITGAASGMGESHARKFVEEGAKVIIADIADQGQKLAEELGDNIIFIKLDVTDENDWEKTVNEIENTFGTIDVLVNNAATMGPIEHITEYSVEDYKNVIDVNQLSVFLGMKFVYPSMKKNGSGSIINVSSGSGFFGTPGQYGYDSSKFAVRGITKTAAKEFASDNIRVNSLHPGPVDTGFMDSEDLNEFVDEIPLERMGNPEEITNMAVYLASDESTYSTGAEFKVDGGLTS